MRVDTEFEPLETERLQLRRSRPGDADDDLAYRSDPDGTGSRGGTAPTRPASGRHRRDEHAYAREPGGWVQFTVEEREGGAIVGDVFAVADGEPNVIKVVLSRPNSRGADTRPRPSARS